MKVLFIGPQGSGKSTQAKMLAQYLNVPFISFGQLLRELATQDTQEGLQLRQDMSVGKLVDDAVAAKVMHERVSKTDCQNGFVSDGYARSLHQLSLFDPQFDIVIFLEISDQEVTSRLLKRAATEGRQDDTPEAIEIRLKSYHEYTEPVLTNYRDKGLLHTVSAIGEIADIQNQIREVVDNSQKDADGAK